jgi:sulfate permease, SulP family
LLRHLGDTNPATLIVGILSLVVVLGLRRWLPLVPGSLVVVLLGIAAVSVFGLVDRGVDIVGPIQSGLPSVGLPSGRSVGDYLGLAGAAVGVLLIGFAEGLAAAKTYAAKEGYEIDANRELIGLGASNLGSGLTSGMVVNGSLSKTAVNGGAGATSQLSGLTVAALVVITLLFLTGLFENLPEATLAAVVIAAVLDLVNVSSLRRLYRVWSGKLGGIYGWAARADFLAALAALLGVLVFDTLPGLFIGIGVSILLLLYRASRPRVGDLVETHESGGPGIRSWVDAARHPELTPRPGVVVVRVESGLFFANADNVRDAIRSRVTEQSRVVVLDAETTPVIDVTATEMLAQLAQDLRRDGVELRVACGIGQLRDVLRRAGQDSNVLQSVYGTVDDALAVPATGEPERPSHD